jgi:hypothetical protein
MAKTNELKKGTRIKLRNGWEADLVDNRKGNTRDAKVYGTYTEIGSVYSHDIVRYKDAEGNWQLVEHTKAQLECKAMNDAMFGG